MNDTSSYHSNREYGYDDASYLVRNACGAVRQDQGSNEPKSRNVVGDVNYVDIPQEFEFLHPIMKTKDARINHKGICTQSAQVGCRRSHKRRLARALNQMVETPDGNVNALPSELHLNVGYRPYSLQSRNKNENIKQTKDKWGLGNMKSRALPQRHTNFYAPNATKKDPHSISPSHQASTDITNSLMRLDKLLDSTVTHASNVLGQLETNCNETNEVDSEPDSSDS